MATATVFKDRVRTFTTTEGTGAITPAAAPEGWQTFATALTEGDEFYYIIEGVTDPSQWEVGRGELLGNGTISRDPLDSSNSGGLVDFVTGTKTITLTVASEWYEGATSDLDVVYRPEGGDTEGSLAFGTGLRNLEGSGGVQAEGNTAIGFGAGDSLVDPWANTLIGWRAGQALSDKATVNTYAGMLGNVGNVLIGYNCGPVANGALDNTLVGTSAGLNLTSGMDNAGLGINTLQNVQGGSENAALGHAALQYIVGGDTFESGTGHRLTAVGDMAGRFLNGGSDPKTGGKASLYLGAQSRSASSAAFNETVIGYLAEGRGDHSVVIGNQQVTGHYFPGGAIFSEGHGTTAEGPNAWIDPATGELKRSNGAWQDFTPAFSSASGAMTNVVVNSARYQRTGDTVHFTADFTIADKGTGAGALFFTPPVPTSLPTAFAAFEQVTGRSIRADIRPTNITKVELVFYDNSGPVIVNNYRFIVNGGYEVSS